LPSVLPLLLSTVLSSVCKIKQEAKQHTCPRGNGNGKTEGVLRSTAPYKPYISVY